MELITWVVTLAGAAALAHCFMKLVEVIDR